MLKKYIIEKTPKIYVLAVNSSNLWVAGICCFIFPFFKTHILIFYKAWMQLLDNKRFL